MIAADRLASTRKASVEYMHVPFPSDCNSCEIRFHVAVWNETWARFFQIEYAQITYSFDVHSFDLRAVPGTEACSCWCRDTTSAIPGHSNQMFVMASG